MSTASEFDPTRLAPADDDIAKCVACGLCLPHCPTFRVTGRETASPRGRIAGMRAVAEGRASIDEAFTRMMDECLACRACEAACPSAVPFGRMIEAARAQVEPHRPAPARGVRALGLSVLLPHHRLTRAAGWAVGIAQATGLDRLVPRARRATAPRVSLAQMRTPYPAAAGDGPAALLLTGCVMDVAFRPTHRAVLGLLAASGYRAAAAPGGCCGALSMHYGRPGAARAMARRTIAAMDHADVVVVDSAGCSAHMKSYGELLAGDPRWGARAERFAERVRDVIEMDLTPSPGTHLGRVAVHDACHHVHAQGIAAQPRALLRAGGADLVEVPDGTRCCGAAGLYSVTQPGMSAVLRRQKAEAIASTGAPVVSVANPGCALQISAGLAEIGADVRVAHPAELLHPPG